MDFAFKTIHEFNDFFKDELTCYRFYEQQRWADGKPICPHCGSAKAPYTVKPRGKFQDIPSYRCSERECKLPFTVRTGTIFEGSKVELRKWFQAAYEITTSKKGISSVELATRIGVSQKTAWFINHRLRNMLNEAAPELLSGVIEVDETFIGGKEKNKSKSVRAKRSKHAAPVAMWITFLLDVLGRKQILPYVCLALHDRGNQIGHQKRFKHNRKMGTPREKIPGALLRRVRRIALPHGGKAKIKRATGMEGHTLNSLLTIGMAAPETIQKLQDAFGQQSEKAS